MDYVPDTAPVCEGDDSDDPPLRVFLFGKSMAIVDHVEVNISAQGRQPIQVLGQKLITLGFDPHRQLSIYKGGQYTGRTTVGKAAGVCDECRGRLSHASGGSGTLARRGEPRARGQRDAVGSQA